MFLSYVGNQHSDTQKVEIDREHTQTHALSGCRTFFFYIVCLFIVIINCVMCCATSQGAILGKIVFLNFDYELNGSESSKSQINKTLTQTWMQETKKHFFQNLLQFGQFSI